jgi:hypothetical protein
VRTEHAPRRVPRRSEVVAGYLAALSIFASAISVAWHPLRLVIVAMLLALLSSAMSTTNQRLPFAAVLIAATSFFVGMSIAVATQNPLW